MIILYYYCLLNVFGFLLMWTDKRKARKHKWRIKENTLWTFAFLGGAFSMTVAMFFFRHKTKHLTFLIGFPLLTIFHAAIVYYINF